MALNDISAKPTSPKTLLSFITIIACALLSCINLLSFRVMSANRAYVNGESQYSKAQKDAIRHLTAYLYSGNDEEWHDFTEEIKVMHCDSLAKALVLAHQPDSVVRNSLIAGRNAPEDVNDIIWLFKYFHTVPFVAGAIREWQMADTTIAHLYAVASSVHSNIQRRLQTDATSQRFYFHQITTISNELTRRANNFSTILGQGSRLLKQILIGLNIFFVLAIIGSVSCYYIIALKSMTHSRALVESQNKALQVVNADLSRLVYSVSHDLRSPIHSLHGLCMITKSETNLTRIQEHLQMMDECIVQQDAFIDEVVDYHRNKRKGVELSVFGLDTLIHEVISQHKHMEEAQRIIFHINLQEIQVRTDATRIKIILNNLLSNAINYSDKQKKISFISITSYAMNSTLYIIVADNGIGIDSASIGQIFDLFFVSNAGKGTGLGLHIIKETIQLLNGDITVQSSIEHGTTFTITLPYETYS